MAGTTPIWGFPYPTGTDRVADGDNAIEALARGVESAITYMQLIITSTGISPGGGWAGTGTARKSGPVVGINFDMTRASWGAGDAVGYVAAGYTPPVTLYFFGMDQSAMPVPVRINSDGSILTVTAGSGGGILGAFTFVKGSLAVAKPGPRDDDEPEPDQELPETPEPK
jgi:hypothetical protein